MPELVANGSELKNTDVGNGITLNMERGDIAWLEKCIVGQIKGLPLEAWNVSTITSIASLWGKVIKVDDDTVTRNRLDCARILLGVNCSSVIPQSFKVVCNGVKHWIRTSIKDFEDNKFWINEDASEYNQAQKDSCHFEDCNISVEAVSVDANLNVEEQMLSKGLLPQEHVQKLDTKELLDFYKLVKIHSFSSNEALSKDQPAPFNPHANANSSPNLEAKLTLKVCNEVGLHFVDIDIVVCKRLEEIAEGINWSRFREAFCLIVYVSCLIVSTCR
ncbi:hypothetical protein V6N13_091211 [Hibiscus sabdariffa]|uniref:DUF4283 domain-containing protein n=1 Tax=Hibiscus sabdariffa TaxID=183260 RepID=A0ABR2R328_9ROSI